MSEQQSFIPEQKEGMSFRDAEGKLYCWLYVGDTLQLREVQMDTEPAYNRARAAYQIDVVLHDGEMTVCTIDSPYPRIVRTTYNNTNETQPESGDDR